MNAAPGNASRPDLVRLGVLFASDTDARIMVRECIERHVDPWMLQKLPAAEDSERSIIRQWAGRARVAP